MRHAFALALLAAALPVCAQEGEKKPVWDLQTPYRWKAGDKVRVKQRQDQTQRVVTRAGLQVVDEQTQRTGFEQRYLLLVSKVDEKGRIAEATRRYEELTDLSRGDRGEPVQVAGLEVRWIRDPDGALRWEAPPGATLDPFLREVLNEDQEEKDAAEKDAGQEGAADPTRLLLPTKPVAEGESWELPLKEVQAAFGVESGDVLDKKLQGTLRGVEPGTAPAPTYLQVELVLELKSRSFQGTPCPKPVEYALTGSARLPHAGASPEKKLALQGLIRGTAPAEEAGAQLEFEVRLHMSEEHARAE